MKIAFTSISPRHHIGDAQLKAVESWQKAGFEVISINSPLEIEELKTKYPIKFVQCYRTMEGLFKAPYVPISAFFDYAKEQKIEQFMLINSDISLSDGGLIEPYWEKAKEGLVFANRFDHDDFQRPQRYEYGFDVFIIHQDFYKLINQSMFCMGQTWWDYWLPYKFLKNNVPIHLITDPMFFHQRHPIQYSSKEWEVMTRHFQWIENYLVGRSPQLTTNNVYKEIKAKCK